MSKDSKNKWFAMSQKKDKEATVYLYDQIGGWGVTAKDFISELNSYGKLDTIHLHVNSGGGSVVEGNAIYNILRNHEARVVTYVDSLAASMASVIALAGDEVNMAENAMLMIHNPWTISIGEADQLRKDADLLDKMKQSILSAYRRSGKDDEELSAIMDAETWYTAEEALESGFIDTIEGANLAAASISDFKTVKENGYSLPQAKLDALTIKTQSKRIEHLEAKISDFDAKIEATKLQAAEEKEAALVSLEKNHGLIIEGLGKTHEAELKESKEITQKAISDKAAQLLAESGAPAVKTEPEGTHQESSTIKMTKEQFWEGYGALKNQRRFEEAQAFYAENKHILK